MTERARDGTFLPRALPAGNTPPTPRAPPGRMHAYLRITEAAGSLNESLFLPAIWEAKSPPPPSVRRYDRLWIQEQPWRWNVEHLMDIVAGLLGDDIKEYFNVYDQAFAAYDPLRHVFLEPPPATECMPIERLMVKDTKYVYMNTDGYVQITLFYQAKRTVRIGAHLFIMWAIKGMPPSPELTQAMHCCPGEVEEASCVQPEHLAWATPSENAIDYRHRLHLSRSDHSPRSVRNKRRRR
jgi:hypothetical protein